MYRIIQILLFIFLWPLSFQNPDEEDVMITKALPMVECTNELLRTEILHYLGQQSDAEKECYWNLVLSCEHDMFFEPVLYKCSIFRQPGYIPNEGTAYLQFGKDIIVIEGKYDRSFFKEKKGNDRSVTMLSNRIPCYAHVAYLTVVFSEGTVFQIQSEYDPAR